MASYRDELEAWAVTVGSDGCTVVPEFYRICCLEHDHAYVTGKTFRGVVVSKQQADQRFRDCIQANSSFRWLSPMSWWRWLAVSWFGRGVWSKQPTNALYAAGDLFGTAAQLRHAAEARRRVIGEMSQGEIGG